LVRRAYGWIQTQWPSRDAGFFRAFGDVIRFTRANAILIRFQLSSVAMRSGRT
jgi:hypothetical protein